MQSAMGNPAHPLALCSARSILSMKRWEIICQPSHEPYAWYLRVPDLPGFLNHIKPALEKRLAESIAVGHSREIKISFYRDGLRLVIEKGKLTAIEPWKPTPEDGGVIAFPDLTFLQLLFGYRSYDELDHSFADCWCDQRRSARA